MKKSKQKMKKSKLKMKKSELKMNKSELKEIMFSTGYKIICYPLKIFSLNTRTIFNCRYILASQLLFQ